ncbi:gluconate permease [Blastopirellula marina]|uniref:Gluconate permease n=1 Tax=Blastopirellula marina TaxID=124 RepID=A0A2S8FPG1_9BACT|nr:gluconate permease [Blastopirellula marina]PTL43834.1 gluconate permease [Blastopirellula marina]
MTPDQYALLCLLVGMATVLGLIIVVKANAFLALIAAAMVVSLMADGPIQDKFSRVASSFGGTAGGVGIVIALAAVIGKCMLDSGAADRVVRAFMSIFGEKRSPIALMGSGFVLAVPVFFDTVFYLLVPLARSLFRKTQKNYLLYVMAIATGGAITHTLVPPTPGPLVVADQLNVDKGLMILIGATIAFPAACVGLWFSSLMNRWMPLPMRPLGAEPEPEAIPDDKLPSLWLSLAPVLLPVILISTNTVLTTMADAERAAQLRPGDIADWAAFRQRIQQGASAEGEGTNFGKHVIATIRGDGADPEREALASLLLQDGSLNDGQKEAALDRLNQYLLVDKSFPKNQDAFLGSKLSSTAVSLSRKPIARMSPVEAERMNRETLESVYGPEVLKRYVWNTRKRELANITSMLGDANFALLLSAVIAMWTLAIQRQFSLKELASSVEVSLMSGGLIILITAAGGAFGAMLTVANVGDAIQHMFPIGSDVSSAKLLILFLGFSIAAVLKIAQGSSTVAMITSSGMLVSLASPEVLGCHPVYLAVSIGAGSLIGSWMNDSGFWIFAKMSGLTEVETLKTWTTLFLVLGTTSFLLALLMAVVMPLT